MSGVNGHINLLKPPGMTSFQVVHWLKKYLKVKKAGHTGTLDPAAAGVLPVCLGRATKIIPYLSSEVKSYLAELTLGIETDTLDAEGTIINQNDNWQGLSSTEIDRVFQDFKGEIEQLPPMYSAVHHNGKRLYELAREGKEVKREPRQVLISQLEIIRIKLPVIHFQVTCSRGTYIRSLAADIGNELGTGAHLSFLIRTRSGAFTIDQGVTLEDVARDGHSHLLPMDYPLEYRSLKFKNSAVKKVKNGGILTEKDIIPEQNNFKVDEIVSVYNQEGIFYALYKIVFINNDRIKCRPVRIFNN